MITRRPASMASAMSRLHSSIVDAGRREWKSSSNWSITTQSAPLRSDRASAKLNDRCGAGTDDDHGFTATSELGDDPGQHDRGLAAARGSRHGEERRSREPGQRGADVVLPTEELIRLVLSERLQTAVRATGVRRGGRRRGVQRRVLPQDPGLHGDELGAGRDTEFLVEARARAPQRGQRVGLATGAVQRRGEDHPPPFAERVGSHEALRVRNDGSVLAGFEPGREQVLFGGLSDLLEPFGLRDRLRPFAEIRVRRPVPE